MASNLQSSAAQPLRLPAVGSAGPPQNFVATLPTQFRPLVPAHPMHQFVPPPTQQFQPVAEGIPGTNIVTPSGQNHVSSFPQPTQQPPPISSQPSQMPPPSQSIPVPYGQLSRPMTYGSLLPHQAATVTNNVPTIAGTGVSFSLSYTFVPSHGQGPSGVNASSHYQPAPQLQTAVPPPVGHPWAAPGTQNVAPVAPVFQTSQQPPLTANATPVKEAEQSMYMEQSSSDWLEHTSGNGKRFYFNKKTRQSIWEKPPEIMTAIERVDDSAGWKECTAPDGQKYYYNKVTKQSKWTMPEDIMVAREQAGETVAITLWKEYTTADGRKFYYNKFTKQSKWTLPDHLKLVQEQIPKAACQTADTDADAGKTSDMSTGSVVPPEAPASTISSVVATPVIPDSVPPEYGVSNIQVSVGMEPPNSTTAGASGDASAAGSATNCSYENASLTSSAILPDGISTDNLEEAKPAISVADKVNITVEETLVDEEPLLYTDKLEAKNAFKELLESANIESDSTWEQAMRAIINDKRYGVIKTLAERKQIFNEYLSQRKKQDAEERRIKQKKARNEFIKMLEECKELTAATKWRQAMPMLEIDARFNAVEREKDREDLFESYMVELEKKERAKAAEEHRKSVIEYRAFLQSCDFIKADTQWRKVQDRLEADDRFSQLEKIDRLEIFQEYVRDLEKEEEEQKKMQNEQLRRAERKNREDFRRLMEGHIASGILTAKTHWRDYCMQVKELPAYMAVAANTSGSTSKDLFEDVVEELNKKYHDDKAQIKDVMKMRKINMASSWTFDDFTTVLLTDESLKGISNANLKLVFEELLERVREKEEKEAKRRQSLTDNFSNLLFSIKEITASSRWDECKPFFEDKQEYRAIGDVAFGREIFEDYISYLREKLKEKERKREEEKAKRDKELEEREKRKEKRKKEKEREREKEKDKLRSRKDHFDGESFDAVDNHGPKVRRSDGSNERKHRKHYNSTEDSIYEMDEREEHRKLHRHNSSESKKSRKRPYSYDSDGDFRHKRHEKDRDGSWRNS